MDFKNPLGKTIFERSYALRDEQGNVLETFEQACRRVAKFAALNKKQEDVRFFKKQASSIRIFSEIKGILSKQCFT